MRLNTPLGSSLQYTDAKMRDVEAELRKIRASTSMRDDRRHERRQQLRADSAAADRQHESMSAPRSKTSKRSFASASRNMAGLNLMISQRQSSGVDFDSGSGYRTLTEISQRSHGAACRRFPALPISRAARKARIRRLPCASRMSWRAILGSDDGSHRQRAAPVDRRRSDQHLARARRPGLRRHRAVAEAAARDLDRLGRSVRHQHAHRRERQSRSSCRCDKWRTSLRPAARNRFVV